MVIPNLAAYGQVPSNFLAWVLTAALAPVLAPALSLMCNLAFGVVTLAFGLAATLTLTFGFRLTFPPTFTLAAGFLTATLPETFGTFTLTLAFGAATLALTDPFAAAFPPTL